MKISMSAVGAADGFLPPQFGRLPKGLWYEENHWARSKGVKEFIMHPENSRDQYLLKYDPNIQSNQFGWSVIILHYQPAVFTSVRLATFVQAELCMAAVTPKLLKKGGKKK